ncbi:MAG TPA: LAGLIDADG family homing endonuclease [Nitriliruptorales bacterium]|nr:LAGLIDADG family homing endonuclease [Nitriliruptorales bacterium]
MHCIVSPDRASPEAARAYIAGATRDGHVNRLHQTLCISQADPEWLLLLQILFEKLGSRSWIYRESARRSVWTLEICRVVDPVPTLDTLDEVAAFVRGYFDAEGGIPRDIDSRFYIQICQKDRRDLIHLRRLLLERLSIACGRLHNPSVRIDPEYWRFYVRASGHSRFAAVVGSWHPIKARIIAARFGPARPLDYQGSTTLSFPKPSA